MLTQNEIGSAYFTTRFVTLNHQALIKCFIDANLGDFIFSLFKFCAKLLRHEVNFAIFSF